jgi:hypothetical protein
MSEKMGEVGLTWSFGSRLHGKVFEICMYVLHTVCNLPYDNVVFEICLSLRPKASNLRVPRINLPISAVLGIWRPALWICVLDSL